MKTIIKLVDTEDKEEIQSWENFLLENNDGNILQSSLMGDVFRSSSFDWNLIVAKQNDSIVGGVLSTIWPGEKFRFLSRFSTFKTTYGPVIVAKNDKEKIASDLLKKLEETVLKRGGMKHIILTNNCWMHEEIKSLGYQVNPYVVGCTFLLDLRKSEEELWNSFKKRFKRSVRNAEKYDIEIKEARNQNAPLIMYNLNVETAKRLKVPPNPFSFLSNVWEKLAKNGHAKFFFAYHRGKPIAGSIVLLYKRTMYAYSTFVPEEAVELSPNQMLKWFIVRWGKNNGYEFFDLLFAPSGEYKKNSIWGQYFFKKSLGGKEIPVFYYEKNYSQNMFILWSKMIIPIYNKITLKARIF